MSKYSMTLQPALLAVLLATVPLAGCNTFAGLGQDVQAAGQATTGAAERTRDRIQSDQPGTTQPAEPVPAPSPAP